MSNLFAILSKIITFIRGIWSAQMNAVDRRAQLLAQEVAQLRLDRADLAAFCDGLHQENSELRTQIKSLEQQLQDAQARILRADAEYINRVSEIAGLSNADAVRADVR